MCAVCPEYQSHSPCGRGKISQFKTASPGVTFVIAVCTYFIAAQVPEFLEFGRGVPRKPVFMPEITKRMDRSEIAKRIERAEKLLQKGKPADALQEYQQVLAADPGNDAVCQMAADLCLSLQRVPEAAKLLGELFDRQIQAGDATRASLTYKKLSRYVTPTYEQKLSFGRLLEHSHRKQAIETYEEVLQELTAQGRKQESLLVLQRIVALEGNERNIARLAELCSAVGDGNAAAAAFLKLADLAKSSGGNSSIWIERAYSENPTDPVIALAYSNGLIEQGQLGAAIFVLETQVNDGHNSVELRQSYAKALLAANRLSDAEPILWQLFEQDPSQLQEIANLIGMLLDAEQDEEAVALAQKLEQFQQRKNERRAFIAMMHGVINRHRAAAKMLEFMAEQFNSANREGDYAHTLLKLFDLYCGAGDYAKAADCFDRAAEVDAYEKGHQKRLETLRGKIDENRFKVIASRLSSVNDSFEQPAKSEEKLLGSATLQDLMLQAEILVQYGMRSKALERLQRIQELFPHEEERNPNLQQLYMTAGLIPQYADSPRSTSSSSSHAAVDATNFTRVSEITRKIYQQSTADAVASTVVSEIGPEWKVDRCYIALRKPGMAPNLFKEYCGAGTAADANAWAEIANSVHELAIARGSASFYDASAAPELQSVRTLLTSMNITSLLALPLANGSDQVGVLILATSVGRRFSANEEALLKTICDQAAITLSNAGLRRLVKSLSVTDEKSGLLKRASYLDLLSAEVRRAVQNNRPVTVILMQFGQRAALMKEVGESALEAMMLKVGQLLAANVRQNDLVFRYDVTTAAIVLAETSEAQALTAAQKLQKLFAELRVPDKQAAVPFHAGVAEAVMRPGFDPLDIVTEVINRAEMALDSSLAKGAEAIIALGASLSSAAVA